MHFSQENSPASGGPADGIRIDGLRLVSTLGVHPEERAAPREARFFWGMGDQIE